VNAYPSIRPFRSGHVTTQSREISANSPFAERKQIADRKLLCRILLKKPSFPGRIFSPSWAHKPDTLMYQILVLTGGAGRTRRGPSRARAGAHGTAGSDGPTPAGACRARGGADTLKQQEEEVSRLNGELVQISISHEDLRQSLEEQEASFLKL
jgi:hypothetical protein